MPYGRRVRHISTSTMHVLMSRGPTERFCVGEKNLWHLNFSAAAAHAWPFSSRAAALSSSPSEESIKSRVCGDKMLTVGDAVFLLLAPLVTRDRSANACVAGEEQKVAGLASALQLK
jgi:hypothetical protein